RTIGKEPPVRTAARRNFRKNSPPSPRTAAGLLRPLHAQMVVAEAAAVVAAAVRIGIELRSESLLPFPAETPLRFSSANPRGGNLSQIRNRPVRLILNQFLQSRPTRRHRQNLRADRATTANIQRRIADHQHFIARQFAAQDSATPRARRSGDFIPLFAVIRES